MFTLITLIIFTFGGVFGYLFWKNRELKKALKVNLACISHLEDSLKTSRRLLNKDYSSFDLEGFLKTAHTDPLEFAIKGHEFTHRFINKVLEEPTTNDQQKIQILKNYVLCKPHTQL